LLFENSNPLTNRNEKGLFYSVDSKNNYIFYIILHPGAVKIHDFISTIEGINTKNGYSKKRGLLLWEVILNV
jgi:hypothetical protein